MRLIAHRGNTQGRNKDLENHPNYITNAIKQGFDAEIDIWLVDGFDLGHNKPQYSIDIDFLFEYCDALWIHCKNLEALFYLTQFPELNVFWHQIDDYTLTSKNFIWTYPEKQVTTASVLVVDDATQYAGPLCYGLCSDTVV
ncbi:hypothetical protein CMO96_02035 [Candidatus Woesebacteria bacterium]|nr:hypothetical protein [Candidatus Woesebacteria bacterium]